MDAMGLYRSGLDVEELDASGPILTDPAIPEPEEPSDADPEAAPSRFEPFVAPIPFRSPSLGWGGALTLGSIVHVDLERRTPPSTVAVAGFGSENESFGGVFSFRGHLLEDLVRPRFAFAMGRANYDFFGVGSDAGSAGHSAELRTEFVLVRTTLLFRLPTEGLGRLGRSLYLGPVLEYRENDHSVQAVAGLPPGFPLPSFDEDDLGLGFAIERDTRNDNFAPSAGTLLEIETRFFSDALGGEEDYQTYDLALASYHDVGFGLRFQLTRESQLNYRSDVGWGRDGFEFHFSLGEEF